MNGCFASKRDKEEKVTILWISLDNEEKRKDRGYDTSEEEEIRDQRSENRDKRSEIRLDWGQVFM